MTQIHSGFFLIADITGYTGYLSASELDHAQGTLTDLLKILIDHTRPPLVISRLAGDAVISYGLGDGFLSGQTFVEMIEDTYVAFRRAIDLMVMNNTCRCRACSNVGNLDLKFFVHYGTFSIQHLDAHDELVGSDVNLLHRLLKNSVVEQTGIRAYTLYTDPAIRQLGLDEICATMISHTEAYEHLGEIQTWVQDMALSWAAKKDLARIELPPEKVIFDVAALIDLPLETVWDDLVDPAFRKIIFGSDRQEIIDRQAGRVDVGSTYLCYHGDKLNTQVVLEWQPFERMVTDERVWFLNGWIQALGIYTLEPQGERTQLRLRMGNVRADWRMRLKIRMQGAKLSAGLQRHYQALIEQFRDQVEADAQTRQSEVQPPIDLSPEQIAAAAAAGLQDRPAG